MKSTRSPRSGAHLLVAPAVLLVVVCGASRALHADELSRAAAALAQPITRAELAAGHPEPRSLIYHSSQHSLHTQDVTHRYAVARGLPPHQVKLLSEVALLHDWDPGRAPGTPARVPQTLKALADDFYGRRPLIPGYKGRSVLRERLRWGKRELALAQALIQRTEFPFGESHPSPAYRKKSPLQKYAKRLRRLSPQDRAFVLKEGAVLSEYADKASWYMKKGFGRTARVVEGLVNEINTSAGAPVMSVGKLGTAKFLRAIGHPQSFEHDRALARALAVKGFTVPDREAFLKAMPAAFGRIFKANAAAYKVLDRELAKGRTPQQAAFKARRAAIRALKGQNRAARRPVPLRPSAAPRRPARP